MTRAPYIECGDTALCTGCGACDFTCPTGAISMTEDGCGFVYPAVDESACVGCGRCLGACHMARPDDLKAQEEPAAYGAYDKNPYSLRRSASGGVATLLCRGVIDRGGVAYGCVARREDVRHERLASPDDLEHARGSKYVQSDIASCFSEIAADLANGTKVLFVGTPCQCAAMRAVFGDHEGLLLVDLVCEGVPSRRMYADFLDDLEAERGQKVSDFRFRDKRGGWSTKNAVIVGGKGVPLDRQLHSYRYYYYWLFSKALILRDSCYKCPYACSHRVGDLTVGDFWGAETSGLGYSLHELKGGISCLLVSTARGSNSASWLGGLIDIRECNFRIVAQANSCLTRSSSCDMELRNEVLSAYSANGSQGMESNYRTLFGHLRHFRDSISSRLPLSIRVAIKKAHAAMAVRS